MRKILRLGAFLAVVSLASRVDATAEICGNDIDDDGNGLTDEGCYPTLTTGVCESPLSCADTGMVSWTTGSLHYDLPADEAPKVPFGPGIGFRRFYTPSYLPGGAGPASVNHTPLGPGWQHTYMTWLDAYTTGTTKHVLYHTSQGRDVLYTYSMTLSGFDYYTPQAGDHVLSLKYDTTNLVYYVQLLTGETLKFNSVGQIIEIWDTLPTPNKVLITWTSTANGNVQTVTDASGQRRLNFVYTNNLLTTLQYQLDTTGSGGWTTEHSVTYDYSNGVTRDATSGWFVPSSTTDWTNLLTGTGIANPNDQWNCQESSGNLADSIGSNTLTVHNTGSQSYAQAITGWTRKALKIADASTTYFSTASSICNPASAKCTVLGIVALTAGVPATAREVFSMGDSNGARAQAVQGGTLHNQNEPAELWKGSNSAAYNSIGLGTSVQP